MNFKTINCILFISLFILLVACNKEKLDSSVTQSNDKKPYLGIVYDANYLKELLKDKEIGSSKNYTFAGIVFKNIVEKKFTLEALYFDSHKSDAFCSDPIENFTNLDKQYILISPDNSLVIPENQNLTKNKSALQYWEVFNTPQNSHMKPFVFFGKRELEILLSGDVESITFSGAQINHGLGLRDSKVTAVDPNNPTTYPTLKAESNLKNKNNNEFIPNTVLALPCPPLWADGGE